MDTSINILKIEKHLINLQGHKVLINRDVATWYGGETQPIHEAAKNYVKHWIVIFGLLTISVMAQNTNVDPSAALEIRSSTQGFLLPRMTTLQRNAIANPAIGLVVFNRSTQQFNYYDGSQWTALGTPPVSNEQETVLSATGKTWMAKNLGANNIATSATDVGSYGALFQWGRPADGHQWRSSATRTGPVSSGFKSTRFITSSSLPFDWLSTQDDSRWNGSSKGDHDPCPNGFRVPTAAEWDNERQLFPAQNATGALESVLQLPTAGYRHSNTAVLTSVGSSGHYWSSNVSGIAAQLLSFTSNTADLGTGVRTFGYSVRCIKE